MSVMVKIIIIDAAAIYVCTVCCQPTGNVRILTQRLDFSMVIINTIFLWFCLEICKSTCIAKWRGMTINFEFLAIYTCACKYSVVDNMCLYF